MGQGTDGYYYQQHDDGTPYFIGTDGSYHPVIQIQDMTDQFNSAREHVAAFLGYMMQRNNTFLNSAGENLEFTRAIIITGLHTSTATADPHSNRGIRHYGIQLTNDGLFADDESTHLLHFRTTSNRAVILLQKSSDSNPEYNIPKSDELSNKQGG